ncbi:membrane-bound lytic murein transglycosylase MltF [Vibrio sp.]|nr:membrane-bound lytic murein transglycosylase MltF [Vibrio sp.]
MTYSAMWLAVLGSALLTGCQIDSTPSSELEKIQERGVLRVGTLNNQVSYYIGAEGPAGLDFELATQFAKELNVTLEMTPAYSVENLYPALKNGDIDIIAAGLTQTSQRINDFRPGPAYYYVNQQVVYKKGHYRPRNTKQLAGLQYDTKYDAYRSNITIVDNSYFKNSLDSIKQHYPNFRYTIEANSDVNLIFEKIAAEELNYTVANSIQVSLAQRLIPEIAPAYDLTEDTPVSWFLRHSEDESLYALMVEFFGHNQQSGDIARLEEKYFGHVGTFDYVDTRAFIRAIEKKLPQWEALFKENSRELDWHLVAAVAYQESHWNPKARSPTGVRGMMMLTLPTAKSVGVKNRLDPEQSIRGGAKYLARLVSRIPDSIPEDEKVWFALASYNMGYGHMMDARRLTEEQGNNPNAWGEVKKRIPLLKQAKYYKKTKYGYARGDEALNYVENIRRYYQTLQLHYIEPNSDDPLSVEETIEQLPVIDIPLNEASNVDTDELNTINSDTKKSDSNRSKEETGDTNQKKNKQIEP